MREIKRMDASLDKYKDEISKILYSWWGKDKGYLENMMKEFVNKNCQTTYVCLQNDVLIGFYQILENDLDIKTLYTPWLANLYVKEEYRGNGVGRFMIEHAINECKIKNYFTLYLHSRHHNFYEKFGFTLIEEMNVLGEIKRIYKLNLNH